MSASPETPLELLARLTDREDQAAWQEFSRIYSPVIHRLAVRRGMQHADADDLVQQVLAAVAKAIDRWQVDPARAKFRTWLHRIAQNMIINAVTRAAPDRGAGDTAALVRLHEQSARSGMASDLVRTEFRREMFRWAAEQIRGEFQPTTWQAFWQTAVEGGEVQDVAKRLGLSVGAVYAARSRIMRRLREKVAEMEETGE